MVAYYVSTPKWTCLVEVRGDRVVRAAPYMAKWACGESWSRLRYRLEQSYGTTLRIAALSPPVDAVGAG